MSFDNVEDIYVLSPMQQGMLFHTLYTPNAGAYILQSGWELRGELNEGAFRAAWQYVIERRSILRTGFVWEGLEKPLQVVLRSAEVPWRQHDWRGRAPDEQEASWERLLEEDRGNPFALDKAPLMRFQLVRLDERLYRFAWSYHHMLLDGWSSPLVLKDVFSAYKALDAGRAPTLEKRRPYRDYIAWLQKQDLKASETFWRQNLRGFSEAIQPIDLSVRQTPKRRQPSAGETQASRFGEQTLVISEQATSALQSFARAHQLTLNTLLQGAWALLLGRYSGAEDIVYGTVVAGRPATVPGVESMIGLFVNTLPFRIALKHHPSLADSIDLITWLKDLQDRQAELRQYEYSPLMQIQAWSEVPRGQPLFESILAFENYPQVELDSAAETRLRVAPLSASARTHYPLELVVVPRQTLGLRLSYDRERFAPETIERMLAHLRFLLHSLPSDGALAPQLVMLNANERDQLQPPSEPPAELMEMDVDDARLRCLHQLFEEQVERRPAAPAVIFGAESLTYGELNRRANRLARYLRQRGVGPEVCVAVFMKRSLELIVSLLAIVKAGGCYVPLDPAYPGERLTYILDEVRAPLVLTSRALSEHLPQTDSGVLAVDDLDEQLARQDDTNLESRGHSARLANIMYTSGSTGRPKGTMIAHRSIVNLVYRPTYVRIDEEDSLLLFSSIAFDVATFEIWGSLLNGARLVVAPADLSSLDELAETIRGQRVSVLWLTSGIFNQMVETHLDGLRGVKRLMTGGEALSASHVRRALDELTGCQIINGYGPTENTTYACTYAVPADDTLEPSVPIGRPLTNISAYVLDEHMQRVLPGAIGELYLGGEGVARGYFKQPALTAERFVPDPFSPQPGARLYKTGDQARQLEDGTLLFEGRADKQVKLRGYRIECGEIEARLLEHPAVRSAAVLLREDRPAEKQLVAYLVPTGPSERPAAGELRAYLQTWLPAYMLPGAYVWLERLPLTPNGKLDQRALPPPERQGGESTYLAPRTPVEEQLAALWAALFKLERVGITDNFFELGGHSILAIRLIGQVQAAFGVQVPLSVLFEQPTVMGMALAIVQQQMEQNDDDELERLLAEVEGLAAQTDNQVS
ncbi:non-ribosomal peptide synthetase [Dictyobacter aurantiacus]|uniref:Carrier domain-containing protein n=1 Tax=Dictyobacter aurantiacus TaxID=1936993 RepID=A0A401ZKK5_9CHLR|nr:non-ribosomal peptide synthetase [Dictyobacter aurantiacus]GCE07389.1 hypothetical protein KDAU_47180 [Dictyobacter aurantiacus]